MARIRGTQRNDELYGGRTADRIFGLNGADELFGRGGADVLRGGAGNDSLHGGGGADRLFGGKGRDEIEGGAGRDVLKGGAGKDELDGGKGADRLDGGKGADTLDGGKGDDDLRGGAGADVFLFGAGDGKDTIRDFENGLDRISIDDMGENDLRALIDGARQVDADVVLDLGNGSSVTLKNMSVADLDLADFIADDDDDSAGAIRGDGGNNALNGTAGDDRLFGGAGNDTLDGGSGDDTMTGDAGADFFVYAKGGGADVISDFDATEDKIVLRDSGYTGAELQAAYFGARQVGEDVLIDFQNGDTLLLEDQFISNLNSQIFIY